MNDPLWYKDAVIYEAHVKSFFDSNNDGIGDFKGLTQKLDYLQGLGITCVWLLPFFPSPLKDDGYDVADYCSVHPSYGTLDDFAAFVDAAHERQIKVLIELVVNHTSDQHPWFNRARHAPAGSPEREFYIWSDTDQTFPETRIIFSDTEKSNWTWDPVAGQYYWHRFFSHQPDLNHNNPAVVDAVIDVLRFWLDRGVDAMRLDAVAYLCVREGTANENLAETHDVLKRMRREVDTYPDRMLLAEANQWPSDVRPYFGEGDECHMAFHFPLMPRMFMAVRQEDRHAITEILNQTPDIPSNCQWALFLRNHDELTVEMITDEERDYMYQAYANDPQMRVNGGIRRRLAPLVENSRRRVELLTALLFSLPGTPVIYYGDEIGMGDNIYLGDRNGVRTPMQWSGDRNGGFSRADPARLFAPPIQDPVYGYQAINVEAQERHPFSLLNWMKRMIALRRQHPVFGRGSLEFVSSPNRKILAFLRRDDREIDSGGDQPVARRAAGDTRPVGVRRPDAGRDERPHRISAHRRPAVLPDARPVCVVLVLLQQESMPLTPRATAPGDAGHVDRRNAAGAADGRRLEQRARRRHARRPRTAGAACRSCAGSAWMVPAAREIRQARFADWSLLRDRLRLPRSSPSSPSTTWTAAARAASCRWRSSTARRPTRRCDRRRPAWSSRITGARKGAIVDGLSDDDTCDRLFELIDGSGEAPTKQGRRARQPHAGADDRLGPAPMDARPGTTATPSPASAIARC